jgi:hypothetical protein
MLVIQQTRQHFFRNFFLYQLSLFLVTLIRGRCGGIGARIASLRQREGWNEHYRIG